MKISEMNQHQKLAFEQVVHASNWVIGGYENRESDEGIAMPSREELFNEIYETVMTCTTGEGFQRFSPIKEVRFAGTEFINKRINRKLTKEGF